MRSQRETILRLERLNESQAKSIEELTLRLQELLSQLVWLNHQLFGKRSEKLARLDPNQTSLFEEPSIAQQPEQQEISPVPATEIEELQAERKTERRNSKLPDGLPVVEVRIAPEGIDHERYKCIGEERTRTLEFEPGRFTLKR